MNAPPLSDLIFCGFPYKLKFCVEKINTSFASEVLPIFTVGNLLNLSTAIIICFSRLNFFCVTFRHYQFGFLVSVRLSILISRFRFSVLDILNSYPMTGLFTLSLLIFGLQKISCLGCHLSRPRLSKVYCVQ